MIYRKVAVVAAVMLSSALAVGAHAEPGGCLKYGAAGAVGGHLADHHGVLGATAGCVVGMYKRHEYRKEARMKAHLYDQEHPGAKGSYEQKATAYDVEHSTTPGAMTPSEPPHPAQPPAPAASPAPAEHL